MKKKARIAIYLPSLDGGGAQRVMLTLANAMAAKVENVDLLLARAEGPFLTQVDESVRIVDLRAGRVSRSVPGVIRYLRLERPDALLSALNYVNVAAIMAKILARVNTRIVVSEHTTLLPSKRRGLRGRVLRSLKRMVYRRADLVVAVSQGVADSLVREIKQERARVQVIYNPVVRPETLQKASEPLNHPWFLAGKPPVVIGIGRLSEEKDFGTLINAVAQLRQTRDVRLLILGEGALRGPLESLVASSGLGDAVLLPGFVPNPFAYLSRATVFVLSSRREGLPTVLIEAMACGTPVVATNCPSGPSEILASGRWGRLVPVGDSLALAEAIAATLDDVEPPRVALRANDFRVAAAVERYLEALLGRP